MKGEGNRGERTWREFARAFLLALFILGCANAGA